MFPQISEKLYYATLGNGVYIYIHRAWLVTI